MDFGSIATYILGLTVSDLIGIGVVAGLGIIGYKYSRKMLDAVATKL